MAQTAQGGLGSTGNIASTQVNADLFDPFGLILSKLKDVPAPTPQNSQLNKSCAIFRPARATERPHLKMPNM